MLFVGQKRASIAWIAQVVAIIAFEMHRLPSQVTFPHELPHPPRKVAKLQVVANRNLPVHAIGDADQFLGLSCPERKWLLDVRMAAGFKTHPGDFKMTFRWCRDMNHFREGHGKHFTDAAELRR